jgi:hypothetical protein
VSWFAKSLSSRLYFDRPTKLTPEKSLTANPGESGGHRKMIKRIARGLCPPLLWSFAASMRRRRIGPIVEDDFALLMGQINPGMLVHGNMELFAHCIANLPSNAPVIEIGSFAGRSLNYLIYLLRKTGKANLVFSVDDWGFENIPDDKIGGLIGLDLYRDHVIETFRRNVELFSGDRLPHHIRLNSDAFFVAWEAKQDRVDFFGKKVGLGGPISFAYIDGDHSYTQSKRDFENVDRFLEPGGFIVFDNSADGSGWGSMQTAKDVEELGDYELVAKNPNRCFRKRYLHVSP